MDKQNNISLKLYSFAHLNCCNEDRELCETAAELIDSLQADNVRLRAELATMTKQRDVLRGALDGVARISHTQDAMTNSVIFRLDYMDMQEKNFDIILVELFKMFQFEYRKRRGATEQKGEGR